MGKFTLAIMVSVFQMSFMAGANAQDGSAALKQYREANGLAGAAATVGDAVKAGDTAVDVNIVVDQDAAAKEIPKTTTNVAPGSKTLIDSLAAQGANTGETIATTKEAQASCIKTTQANIDQCKLELEAAKAAAATCASQTTTNSDGTTSPKDCTAEEGAVTAAEAALEAQNKIMQVTCQDHFNNRIALLENRQKYLSDLSTQSNETLAASSSNGGGNEKKPEGPPMAPPPAVTEPESISCAKDNGYARVECEAHFLKTCPTNLADADCQKFGDRYCGFGQQSTTAVPANGQEFCKTAKNYNFCNPSPTEVCLTCTDLALGVPAVAPTDEQLISNYAMCPADPMFDDPAIMAIVNRTPSTSYATMQVDDGVTPRLPASTALTFQSVTSTSDVGVQYGASIFEISESAHKTWANK